MKRVCVNCGSSPGFDEVYRAAARELGNALVRRKIVLVYGGAEVGLMGEVANTVMETGGSAIGVIPQALADKVSHRGLTELHIVSSMHERKQMMHDLSDAFIALPGGYGTIEEITELLTWAQLGIHQKPVGLINVSGYYDSFLSFLDHAVSEGFMKQEHRAMLFVSEEPEALLDHFMAYEPPTVEKWINRQPRTKHNGKKC
jgi:uncharacterized protein (TIGR00730 family)